MALLSRVLLRFPPAEQTLRPSHTSSNRPSAEAREHLQRLKYAGWGDARWGRWQSLWLSLTRKQDDLGGMEILLVDAFDR